jgi:hypothetical protein
VLRALHQWHLRGDVAVMLEKVEMAPAFLDEIMRFAQCATLRAAIACTAFALHVRTEFMLLLGSAQVLINQLPRRLDANRLRLTLVAADAVVPLRNTFPSMAQHIGGFRSA